MGLKSRTWSSLAVLLVFCLASSAWGQAAPTTPGRSPQPPAQPPVIESPPDTDYAQPVPPPPSIPATGFLMPDVPDDWTKKSSYDGRLFSTTLNLVALIDYAAFVQDDGSRTQVDEQKDQWDVRTVRFMSRGKMKFAHPVDYFVSVELKGKDHVQTDDSKFGLTDLEISTEVGRLGRLKFGKVKEPFVYEMVGDAANLQQQERALNPFFVSRGIGLRLSKTFASDAMSYSVGWFNDWWVEDQRFDVSG